MSTGKSPIRCWGKESGVLETLCLLLGHNYWVFALIEVLVLHFCVLYFFLSEKKRATLVISRVESSKLRSKQIYFFSKPVLESLCYLWVWPCCGARRIQSTLTSQTVQFQSLHKRLIYVVTCRKLQIKQIEMVVLHQHLFCLSSYYLPSTDNKQSLQKGHQVVSIVPKATPNEGWSQPWKVNICLCFWLLYHKLQ